MTGIEIVEKLNVNHSTISRDMKVLSQRFVYSASKSDLAFHYKQCLVGIEEEKEERGRYSTTQTTFLQGTNF